MHRRTVISVITGMSLAAVTGGYTDQTDTESPTPDGEKSDMARASPVTTQKQPSTSKSEVAFEVTSVAVTECGTTCREATVTLANTGSTDATNVHVSATITAGETLVWKGDERIRRLTAGAAVTQTHRIDIGLEDAVAIQRNNGQITIKVTIVSDQQSKQITNKRRV